MSILNTKNTVLSMRWILINCLVLSISSPAIYAQSFGTKSESDAEKAGLLAGVTWRSGLWSEILKSCGDRESGLEVETYLDGLEWFEAGQKYGRKYNWNSSTCTNAKKYADQHIGRAEIVAKANRSLELHDLGALFQVMDCQIGAFRSAKPEILMIFSTRFKLQDLVRYQPQNRDEEKALEKVKSLLARDTAQDKEVRALKNYLVKSQNCYVPAISKIDIPELKTYIVERSDGIAELLTNLKKGERSLDYLGKAYMQTDLEWTNSTPVFTQYSVSLSRAEQDSLQAFGQVFGSEVQMMTQNLTKEFFGIR